MPQVCMVPRLEWTPGEVNERVPGRGNIYGAVKHKRKTTATMANVRCLIHHGRPPSRAAAATRGATNLISGLRATFCGSAVVVGGSGDECGRLVVAATATYTV
jgi:hypothetical protein